MARKKDPRIQKRNKRIYQYHLKHPKVKLDSIARQWHLQSRQLVYYIIKTEEGNNGHS